MEYLLRILLTSDLSYFTFKFVLLDLLIVFILIELIWFMTNSLPLYV